ncbi:molecular chaperone [Paenibacillus sp. 598K]|uniref:polyphosphate polymerase domain-containing protein n=1 Tax=Paenibacillus sp. 598K TaxID=1117987 RepID=UPI000FF9E690|nr:polyphosphate polymerase domain-containing protein [Paenibacillus sp. 598K]GBF72874.1 molecular chaperone [Paenibacillus sp. 598K]
MIKDRNPYPKGRRELKHAITRLDCHLLRSGLRHVMRSDPHAGPGGTYLVRSVYFDNLENKALIQKKEGLYARDKYRVRLYDHNSNLLHLEKKSKRNNQTFKEKCRIVAEEYERMRLGDIAWMSEDERPLIRELHLQMQCYQLKPLTIVDYEREVFTYPHGNVRVTFDSNIRTSNRNHDLLNPNVPMAPALEPDLVVLEIKYDEYMPDIIKKLLQIGNRRTEAYSKYQLSRMYS